MDDSAITTRFKAADREAARMFATALKRFRVSGNLKRRDKTRART